MGIILKAWDFFAPFGTGQASMGVSKCSQYCETGVSEKIGINGAGQVNKDSAFQFSWAESSSVLPPRPPGSRWRKDRDDSADQEISALGYNPPPLPEDGKDVEALLGTPMPSRPRASCSSSAAASPPLGRSPPSQSSRAGGRSSAPSWARPGEPVNKVYVQFSNDLEGFLPYTLVISEAQGLEYTSICSSPDFTLDPLNIMHVSRVDFDSLMQDSFFSSLSKSIRQRIANGGASESPGRSWPPHPLEERVQPPYRAIVQLSVRRTLLDGCQVLVFIAVQSDPLAEELVQSCFKLKKRRAMRVPNDDPVRSECSSRSVSRGCPTPRTAASAAARSTPPRTPQQTPQQGNRELLPPRPESQRPSPVAAAAAAAGT